MIIEDIRLTLEDDRPKRLRTGVVAAGGALVGGTVAKIANIAKQHSNATKAGKALMDNPITGLKVAAPTYIRNLGTKWNANKHVAAAAATGAAITGGAMLVKRHLKKKADKKKANPIDPKKAITKAQNKDIEQLRSDNYNRDKNQNN